MLAVILQASANYKDKLVDILNAKEEGIQFAMLTNPVKGVVDKYNWVKAVKFIRLGHFLYHSFANVN